MFRRHFLKDLSSYIDNQLSESRKQKVIEHLRGCKLCSDELVKLKLLSEEIKKWQAPVLGSDFEFSVTNEIVRQELEKGTVKMKKQSLAILIPSGVLAGILLFAFFGQVYMKRGLEGRFSVSADKIGEEFKAGTQRYEPYYLGSTTNTLQVGGSKHSDSMDFESSAVSFDGRASELRKQSMPASVVVDSGGSSVIVIQPVLPATAEGEKVIRTAQLRLEVEDGKEAYKLVSGVCQELGGYLASSNFYKDNEGRESGTITMRVPKDKFLTALDKLGALGKVEDSSSNSHDVSQEYSNLKARLDAAMVVYNKMLEALQKRQATIPEAMRLESELTPVLRRIEDLKNQIEYLNNAVSFTTITVNFHEPRVSAKVLQETKKDIKRGILTAAINGVKAFANIIRAIPVLITLVIWVGAILGFVFLLKHWIKRIFRRG